MRLNSNSISGFILATFLFLGIGNTVSAQIKIGTNGSAIAPSSILELESNNQGLLLPRLADTISINTLNPPNGMIIYLTKWPAVGLYVRKTTGWEFLTGSLGGNGSFNNLTVGGTLIAQNFSGNLIGNASTATLANTASNAVNVNITNDLSTSTVTYPTFVTNTPGSTSIRTSSTKLSFVPNTGILTAIGFKGNLVGDVTGVATSSIDAVNASNTDVEDDLVSSLVQYPTFVSGTSGNLAHKTSSLNLTYTPLTGELAAKKFTGNLQGNASSATLATEANNSQTIKVTNDIITSAVSYPLFASGISGNQAIKSSSSNLSYIPSTGILTAKGFIGNLTGDVTGTVSNSKNAENAVNITVKEDAASAVPMYPTFVLGAAGPISATINSSKLKYIPATGEFIAPKFVGDLDGNASTTTTATNAANISVTDDSANPLATYPVFVNAITGNQAVKSSNINLSFVPQTGILTANGFVGNLTGNISGQANSALSAINANNALNATNSANAAIVDENSSTYTFYPTFVGTASGNQVIRSSSSNLTYVPSTGILTAKKFVGNLVGDVTGKVSNAELADNASNLEVAEIVPGVATYYPTLVSATTGQTSIKVNNSQLQYLPVAGELISPKFRGELIGNASTTTTATNAANVAVIDDVTNNLPTYPIFVNSPTGNQSVKSSSTNLSYVPSTGILTAKGFVGNVVGNVTGQVSNAQNAENASKINIATNDISAGTVYPVFVSGLSGSLQPNVSTNRLGFKPLTGELTAITFKGDLIGNSFTATTANNATNALNSAVSDDNSTNSTFFPVFVGTASGNQGIKASSANLKFNPSNGILTSTGFAGPLVGNVTGEASSALSATTSSKVSISTDDATAVTMYPTYVSGITGSLPIAVHSSKLGFKPAIGELTATVFKGDLSGIATNATSAVTADNALKSVIIDDASHSAVTYPLFVNDAAGNQPLRSNRTNLSYVPSSGTLTAKEFVGKFVGNLNGIASNAIDATNSANVSVTDDLASNKYMPLTFVDGNSGNLPVKVSSSKLRFNPSTGELISPSFTGNLVGNASTASTISPTGIVLPVNGGTGLTSYAVGDILYAESSNTIKKLAVGPIGSVLRVQQVGTSIIPTWATTGPGTITEVQFGGTGRNSMPLGSVLVGNDANTILTVSGAVGQVLRSNGPGVPPSFQNIAGGDMILAADQVVTGSKTFGVQGVGGVGGVKNMLKLAGIISGVTVLNGPDVGGGVVNLPPSGTLATLKEPETLEQKRLISPELVSPTIGNAKGTSLILGGGTPLITTNQTGLGDIVMSNGAQLVSPKIGDATGSSLNVGGGTITAGTFVGTLNGNASGNANNVSGIVQIANGGTGANTKQAGFDNLSPMTSPGDMIYGVTLGSARRLALGGANEVLKGGLTAPVWGSVVLTSDVSGILPAQNGGTGNAFTEFIGPSLTKKIYTLPNFDAALAITSGSQIFTGTQTFTSTINGNIATASTANKLAATKNINGVPFDGSADIIVAADASTLSGTTLKSTVLNSSLTSVGELTNLKVTNPIDGSITGNSATATLASNVTTNANLTGEVTSVGNATTVTNNAVISKVLTGFSSAAGVVAPTDNIVEAISKLSGNIAASGNATHTGDVEGATNLTIKDGAVTTSKIAGSAITLDKIQDVATNTVLGRATGGTGVLEQIVTTGTGNVVRANSPSLITPNLGAASATSLTVSGVITSNIAVGNAPFVVTSTTPVTNLSIGGSSGSATKLATARAINGVNFDGTAPISIDAPALSLTGNTLNPLILTSSLTSVGKLGALTVTNPIVGSITGNASNVTGTVAITNGGTGATNQQTALNNLAGTQAAGRYLRSDGTNTLLSTILAGDVPTLNQNTTGTAAGLNDAYIDWNATIGGKAILNKPTLKDGTVTSVAALTLGTSGTDLSSSVATNTSTPIITLNVPTASATNRGVLSSADWTSFNSKQGSLTFSTGLSNSSGTITVNSTQNITSLSNLASNGIVSTSGGTGVLAVTPVNGTGNVVLTSDATLVNPNIGTANGSSLTLTGSLTSTATTGTAPFVVSSTTPVNNLNIGGNAASATKLATARAINGIDFDGTASITISSAASTLTGNTLSSIILNSNLTSVGTLGSLSVTNPINGSLAGNAATATKLVASRTIYGNIFDGTANLDQVIAPGFGGTGNRFTEFVGPLGSIKKFTLPDNDAVLARTDAAQTFNGVQTFSSVIAGSINGNAATATTASGLNPSTTITSPNLITPLLGTATATSINKVLITGPVVSATLNLAEASTLATSGANSITLTSTGPTNVTLPTSGILVSAISASGIIDFTAVNANDSTIGTITVIGASDGDAVSLGVPSSLAGAGGIYTAWVSAPDTVTVKFSNTTAVLIDPASATIKIKVLK